ncbi:hypothetical protein [Oscillatoria salina]|uniref:hypothetical protein n=1 Tax=Oscillatoria salina TaxID=331517 RepID=UPI0013B7DF4A|nr:hypothetical protein [Oscillatoria salina]MBZ8179342.1 hypothetical protein [Oscillatoria salina IIICB1]NET91213.1 hypothetical protein [Kamptonema sp. SIO1D9]
MGKQAKLKQQRREAKAKPSSESPKPKYDSTQFVKQLERQGYQLKKGKPSPELPDSKPKPSL